MCVSEGERNQPLHVAMDEAARMVDGVDEMKSCCHLVRYTQTNIPQQTNIPLPVETVA